MDEAEIAATLQKILDGLRSIAKGYDEMKDGHFEGCRRLVNDDR